MQITPDRPVPAARPPAAESPEASAVAPEDHHSQSFASKIVPALGNFSIQYNFTTASIAVNILRDDNYLGYPLEEEPSWSKNLTLPTVFLGAMLGMLAMGRLGDVLGRSKAMQVTLVLTMVGAMIPACAVGSASSMYAIICAGRLVLGVGVGGIYPLSAVASAEGSADVASRGLHVGKAFFWQCVGVVTPYAVAMALVALIKPAEPAEWVPELQFRMLFALGVVPAGIVFLATLGTEDSEEFRLNRHSENVWEAFREQPRSTFVSLVGTAGSWFFFDVACYGTSVFIPFILEAICLTGDKVGDRCEQTVFQTAAQSVVVTSMGIPGSLLSILLVGRMGAKLLNVFGFGLQALVFSILAVVWSMAPNSHALLFGLLCCLVFLLNFGPNLGTYVLPAICFPAHIRSTCHGLSATGGKLGALVGALLFAPMSEGPMGVPGVLGIQALCCVLGLLVSQICLKHDWEYLEPDGQVASESFVYGLCCSQVVDLCPLEGVFVGCPSESTSESPPESLTGA